MSIVFLITLVMGFFFYLSFKIGFHSEAFSVMSKSAWLFLVLAIPSVLNNFYFQTCIPTIASFLKYKKKQIFSCIFVGFSSMLLLFTVWLFFSLTNAGRAYVEGLNKLNPFEITFDTIAHTPFVGRWLPYILATNIFISLVCSLAILTDFYKDLLISILPKKSDLGCAKAPD